MRRALTVYNDYIDGGISLIVDHPDKFDYQNLELNLEEDIASVKKPQEIIDKVKAWPSKFGQVTFLEGCLYVESKSSIKNAPRAPTTAVEDESYIVELDRGHKLTHPDKYRLEFS